MSPAKGGIGHQHVEVEIAKGFLILLIVGPAVGKTAQEGFEGHADFLGPVARVKRVGTVDVGAPVTGNQVERLGDLDRA